MGEIKLNDMAKITPPIEKAKLKISISYTDKKEREISLPYYGVYSNNTFVKVLSEDYVIRISDRPSGTIEIEYNVDGTLHGVVWLTTPCTEEEFNTAFQTALSKIQNL